ncbi:MAG: hypothetical protein C0582_05790 [Alphaproteobacteria bacterium]|nr:MAG: hypothetical protein C0582_05790 [Alphaproteobacteria bacterium]
MALDFLFHVDALSEVMMALVGFITIIIGFFSWRYMRGDQFFAVFYWRLLLLLMCLVSLISADHLALFVFSWIGANYFLKQLMIHKPSWAAAENAGRLAWKYLGVGSLILAFSFVVLYVEMGTASIKAMTAMTYHSVMFEVALAGIVISALIQSAQWPFHKWLLSSLNSPTPVSALMHAGLVNGGGFLLVRFSGLFADHSHWLMVLFIFGAISSLLGTFWKLLQNDVKRMLACSTLSQMGFMVIQCSLGLFAAAVAHLCWHGLFKAYLFLSSGGVASEKRFDKPLQLTPFRILIAVCAGALFAFAFAYGSGRSLTALTTNSILVFIAFIAGVQMAFTLLQEPVRYVVLKALCLATILGTFYGYNVWLIESHLPETLMVPRPLNWVFIAYLAFISAAWGVMIVVRQWDQKGRVPVWYKKLYVKGLNASQPALKTMTLQRLFYRYK